MFRRKVFICTAVFAQTLIVGSASAALLASTNFDGRTLTTVSIAGDTATNLSWTTNGLDDPGDMTALREDGSPLVLFDGSATTQAMFAPALNVGNTNTGWRTNISLTVSSGSNVTLTDVTFSYWAINGGQSPNVARKSDFTITLFNPSDSSVGSVFVDDVSAGPTPAPVSAVFGSSIALTAPGTYRLEIFATEAPETGNHIGIDDLMINGDVSAIPEPSSVVLVGMGLLGLTAWRRRLQ